MFYFMPIFGLFNVYGDCYSINWKYVLFFEPLTNYSFIVTPMEESGLQTDGDATFTYLGDTLTFESNDSDETWTFFSDDEDSSSYESSTYTTTEDSTYDTASSTLIEP